MLPLSASASPRWRLRKVLVPFSRDWSHSGSDKFPTPWWSSPVSRRLLSHFTLMLYQNHVISAQRYSYSSLKTFILELIFSPSNWWSLLPLVILLVFSVPSSRTQLTTLCLSSTRTQALLPVKVSKQFYFRWFKTFESLERNGLVQRLHQGSRCPYHHDRYTDCFAVVHLRWRQSRSPSPTPTTTTNARITSPEVGGTRKERINCFPNQVYSVQIKKGSTIHICRMFLLQVSKF